MMKKVASIDSQEELDELGECIDKCVDCNCIATLKQFVERPDGGYNNMDLQETACSVRSIVEVSNGMVYVTLRSSVMAELKRIKGMWETVRKRGTQNFRENKVNDYALVVDLVKDELEHNTIYIISLSQPFFISFEDEEMLMVFPFDSLYFARESATLDEIEYMQEQEQGRTEAYDDDDTPQSSQFTDNDQFIGTDGFLNF